MAMSDGLPFRFQARDKAGQFFQLYDFIFHDSLMMSSFPLRCQGIFCVPMPHFLPKYLNQSLVASAMLSGSHRGASRQ
jgi:hypothetical protein